MTSLPLAAILRVQLVTAATHATGNPNNSSNIGMPRYGSGNAICVTAKGVCVLPLSYIYPDVPHRYPSPHPNELALINAL